MPEPSRPRRKLKVDMEELAAALDDASGLVNYYLDQETGEVIPVTEEVRTALENIYQGLEGGLERLKEHLAGGRRGTGAAGTARLAETR